MKLNTYNDSGLFPIVSKPWRSTLLGASVLLLAGLGLTPALATSIDPGFDLFATSAGTSVDLPGIGSVALQGVPIGPRNTDTIVRRSMGIDPFSVGDTDVSIPIELVALSLHSVKPVPLGSSFFDVFVTLDPNPMGPTTGGMRVSHELTDGGTFDAQLPVNALLTFIEVGNPGNQIANSFFDVFVSLDAPWSHTPSPGDAHNALFPAGGFFPGVIPGTGGQTRIFDEQAQFALHRVRPSPEPASLALFGAGAFALACYRRKDQRQRRKSKET
ncbi:MAG: PEP-CTERM sorting domain-containing protein [Burkholderiales bacterium]